MDKCNYNSIVKGDKCFVVAEIGINHNGDMELAKDCIFAAAESGADSVKFQNYRTEDFVSDKKLKLEYFSEGKKIIESQYNLFKRCELNRDQLFILKEVCDSLGLVFHSSPTSVDGINDLVEIGCNIIKNGSDFLTNLDIVSAIGNTGGLGVLSTGMSTLAEIDEAVKTFRSTGNNNLILLHCTSSYPTPSNQVNLARIEMLRDLFELPVGFSDHTDGVVAAVGSTLLGARWIEKHFTLDRKMPGPDHHFSINPEQLKDLICSIRSAEKMLGKKSFNPSPDECKSRSNFRLSCVATRNISIGDIINKSDIKFSRPGNGIPPSHQNYLIGRQIHHNISEGEQFKNEYFLK